MAYYPDEPCSDDCCDPDDEGPYFANAGSALRAATRDNPRIFPCPNCEEPNRLTQQDIDLGYQCDVCADRAERGMEY